MIAELFARSVKILGKGMIADQRKTKLLFRIRRGVRRPLLFC